MTGKRANGEGSITQRKDGTWQGAVTTPQGRKYLYAKTKRECQIKVKQATRNQEQGLPAVPKKQALARFLERWLEDAVKPRTRPRVHERYEQIARLHIVPDLGKIDLAALTHLDVQHLYNRKLAQGLAPRTVKHVHEVLHNALSDAADWGLIPRNPASTASAPRVPQREVHPLTPDEARALLAAARGDPLEALYVMALTTAMRQSELLGLHWEDVDLIAGFVQVRRNIQRVKRQGFVEGEPKSKQSRRTITLTPAATDALRHHRARQLEGRLLAGSLWEDNRLVFCNSFGRPIEAGNLLRRSFLPLLERAGIPRIHFHDLRHSAATLLLSLGVHPKIVQEFLGHSQISITMDLYSHSMPTLQEEAVAKLGVLLQPQLAR